MRAYPRVLHSPARSTPAPRTRSVALRETQQRAPMTCGSTLILWSHSLAGTSSRRNRLHPRPSDAVDRARHWMILARPVPVAAPRERAGTLGVSAHGRGDLLDAPARRRPRTTRARASQARRLDRPPKRPEPGRHNTRARPLSRLRTIPGRPPVPRARVRGRPIRHARRRARQLDPVADRIQHPLLRPHLPSLTRTAPAPLRRALAPAAAARRPPAAATLSSVASSPLKLAFAGRVGAIDVDRRDGQAELYRNLASACPLCSSRSICRTRSARVRSPLVSGSPRAMPDRR